MGLNLIGCHDIVVSSNQFEENNDALSCTDGFNLCLTGNCLDDHLRHGVIIENTYGSVLSGNMIEECQGYAVFSIGTVMATRSRPTSLPTTAAASISVMLMGDGQRQHADHHEDPRGAGGARQWTDHHHRQQLLQQLHRRRRHQAKGKNDEGPRRTDPGRHPRRHRQRQPLLERATQGRRTQRPAQPSCALGDNVLVDVPSDHAKIKTTGTLVVAPAPRPAADLAHPVSRPPIP
ncbi:MAG: hypothetical protein CM1200mP2_08870 [Planctomycetaceae bacterium]|nr:MAG: hypothetical protein CM1200mP2_08870 [Planctomycetaceae bacterium]